MHSHPTNHAIAGMDAAHPQPQINDRPTSVPHRSAPATRRSDFPPSLLAALVTAAATAVASQPSRAQPITLFVDDDAPAGGNGTAWNSAFRDLQAALDIANTRGRGSVDIRIAQGTYLPNFEDVLGYTFRIDPPSVLSATASSLVDPRHMQTLTRLVLNANTGTTVQSLASGVSIRLTGGFAGIGAENPDANDPTAFVSVLSADILGNDSGTPASRIDNIPTILYAVMPPMSWLRIEGLTFAHAASAGSEMRAVFLRSDSGNLADFTLKDSTFRDFHSRRDGWGVFLERGRFSCIGCTFEDMDLGTDSSYAYSTAALQLGNGTYPQPNGMSVLDSTFRNIRGSDSAAIAHFSGQALLGVEGCHFLRNRAERGAAIHSEPAYVSGSVRRCTFVENSASIGGAIYSGLTVWDSTFDSNTADAGGACWFSVSGRYVNDSVFRNNSAAYDGGAIHGAASLIGCEFEGNRAARGGAAWMNCCDPIISDCEFTRNLASSDAGAVGTEGEHLAIQFTTFTDNRVESNSGESTDSVFGGAVRGGSVYLYASRFFGNRVVAQAGQAVGGAVMADELEVLSCLFSGNTASSLAYAAGGAIATGASTVFNATLSRNAVASTMLPAQGGGIVTWGTTTLRSSILWNNTANGQSGPASETAALVPFFPFTIRYSNVTGLPTGFDDNANTGSDPLMTDPDGPDNIVGTTDDNLRLSTVASPCIDAADPLQPGVGNQQQVDAEERPRAVATPAVSGPSGPNMKVDRGALEFQGNEHCVAIDLTFDGRVNMSDLTNFLALFGRSVNPGVRADYDANGVVDSRDLVTLLGRFGCSRWD